MTEQRAEFVALAQQPGATRLALCRAFRIAIGDRLQVAAALLSRGAVGLAGPLTAAPSQSGCIPSRPSSGRCWPCARSIPPGAAARLRELLVRFVWRITRQVLVTPPPSPLILKRPRSARVPPMANRPADPGSLIALRASLIETQQWQMDFKSGWPCGAGQLPSLDDPRRPLALQASAWSTDRISAPPPCEAHLITAFQRYGLPDRLLIDNGSPWGNHPAYPYTPLTVWQRRLGHRRQPQPAVPPADPGQGRALPRHPAARPRAAAAAPRSGQLAVPLRCVAAGVQPGAAPTRRWPWR